MIRTIKVGEKEIRVKSSAAVPRIYRRQYGRDLFRDLATMSDAVKREEQKNKKKQEQAKREGRKYEPSSALPIESLEMFENIAYIMAKHADKDIPDDAEEWMAEFEIFDIYEILPQIMDMWNLENKTMVEPKKKQGK